MLNNFHVFSQPLKQMPEDIINTGHNRIFLNPCLLKIYDKFPILPGTLQTQKIKVT